MNTLRICRSIIFILVILVAASGCKKDKKITTKINSDGSCVRTIAVTPVSDTSASFPIPTDQSWESKLEGDTEKVYIASKRFANVNQINDEFRRSDKVSVEIKFEKRFRWFFTYFQYQETYKSCFPIRRIPIQSFLTKEEYARYLQGDTAKALKVRVDEYFMINIFEEFYSCLIDSVEKLHDPSLPVSVFIEKKNTFNIDSMEHNPSDLVQYLEKSLHLNFGGKLNRQIDRIMKSINDRIQFQFNAGGDYTNEVELPGIILSTNADAVEGNKVLWHFNEDKFSFLDFTMTAESRIVNIWTSYISGVVLLVIIIFLLLPRFKKK
jgi:hypothetical protein